MVERKHFLCICLGLVTLGFLLYLAQDVEFIQHNPSQRHKFESRIYSRKDAKPNQDGSQVALDFNIFFSETTKDEPKKKCVLSINETDKPHFHGHMFQKVEGTELFIISAFLDDRDSHTGSVVRILGLAPQDHANVFCQLLYESGEIVQRAATVKVFAESVPPFCKWKTAFIHCPNALQGELPIGVSLSSTNCDTSVTSKYLTVGTIQGDPVYKLGLCTDTVYNNTDSDVGPLIEFIEMQLLLGVDHIILYDFHDVSDNIKKIIEYYSTKGVITIVPWKMPVPVFYEDQFYNVTDASQAGASRQGNFLHGVKKNAQYLAYLDCLYSNMNKYEYLMFLDRDELIIPKQHSSLVEMLNALELKNDSDDFGGYINAEHHFCTKKSVVIESQNNLVQKLTTTIRMARPGHSVKSIVKPKYIYNMHIHLPIPPLVGSHRTMLHLPESLSTVHHYRNHHKCHNVPVIRDTSAMKFQEKLQVQIIEAERNIGIGN